MAGPCYKIMAKEPDSPSYGGERDTMSDNTHRVMQDLQRSLDNWNPRMPFARVINTGDHPIMIRAGHVSYVLSPGQAYEGNNIRIADLHLQMYVLNNMCRIEEYMPPAPPAPATDRVAAVELAPNIMSLVTALGALGISLDELLRGLQQQQAASEPPPPPSRLRPLEFE